MLGELEGGDAGELPDAGSGDGVGRGAWLLSSEFVREPMMMILACLSLFFRAGMELFEVTLGGGEENLDVRGPKSRLRGRYIHRI